MKFLHIYGIALLLVTFSQCNAPKPVNEAKDEVERQVPPSERSESEVIQESEQVYSQPERMPRWPTCSEVPEADLEKCNAQAIQTYLKQYLIYPDSVKESGQAGLVFLRFVIQTDGTTTDHNALMSPSPLLSQLAIETIKGFPRFIPGEVHGEPVKVAFILPIRFVQ